MKIISYNVNGIRAAMRKEFIPFLKKNQFDIICLQEVKATLEQVDLAEIEELGYHIYWHAAEKKGYSGVATFSKIPADHQVVGCGIDQYDAEGRILRTDFGAWTLLNCYFPSGTTGDTRQAFKMEFLADFNAFVSSLRKERPNLVIVGDYNIAHTEMDIHNPKGNKKTSGFLPEEREWMTEWFDSGFVDAYRNLHPDEETYSWWSYRANARANNKGWRIDYQSFSKPIADRLREARHLKEAVHSDHCPVYVKWDTAGLL